MQNRSRESGDSDTWNNSLASQSRSDYSIGAVPLRDEHLRAPDSSQNMVYGFDGYRGDGRTFGKVYFIFLKKNL